MRDKKPNHSAPPALSGTRLQTLALFIILLSFFIVLNSISTFEEERIKPVLKSIEGTFANRVIRNELAPSVTTSEDMATKEGSVYDDFEDLFKSQFRKLSADTTVDHEKGLFITTFPLRKLEVAVTDIRPIYLKERKRTGPFMALLKDLFDKEETKLRIDFVLQTPKDFLTEPPAQQIRLAQKMAFIGQSLETAGFPKDRVSVGFEESEDHGNADTVMIVIRPHTPYEPFTSRRRY